MTVKNFDWVQGVILDEHTQKKHTIVREYFRKYLITRCIIPYQENFKLIVVDGFAGGGLYKCGGYGSPLIFVEVLEQTFKEINVRRAAESMRPVQFECLLILNDSDKSAIELLRQNIDPLIAGAREGNSGLHIEVKYFCKKFNEVFPDIKKLVQSKNCGNVLFNLDQSGL